mmetsp:Transcript_9151/g.13737  ORF Transcript_9151/g.13737 Transcript_9151/m.13737 type:complete len:586 (-) Transcript_9151:36-1793(-)
MDFRELSSSSSSIPTPDETGLVYEIPLAVLILTLYIIMGHGLELWKDHQMADVQPSFDNQPKPLLCTFHESGPAILLGLAVGLLINWGTGKSIDFDANIFFYVVLPPIIFHQGYAFKKRNFFRYFHYIISFGMIGTLLQFVIISALMYNFSRLSWFHICDADGNTAVLELKQCLIMAAVFCAADEVATVSLIKQSEFPKLSAILFGEGIMNDAISILLFNAVTTLDISPGTDISGWGLVNLLFKVLYLCISAGGVGVGSALLVSVLLKCLPSLKTDSVRQTAILMLGGYFSFSISELLGLSGVLTVFFCGLTLSHYAWHSLGTEAQVASKITSDTISMIAEAYCFAAIGLSVHQFKVSEWSGSYIILMIVVLMIARAFGIYGICLLGMIFLGKSFTLPFAEQNVLYFGGLVRGAISWGQAVQITGTNSDLMITTTLAVIVSTVIIFGMIMPVFTRHLSPEIEVAPKTSTSVLDKGPLATIKSTEILPCDKTPLKMGNNMTSGYGEDDDDDAIEGGTNGEQKQNKHKVHDTWAKFDDKFMKPIFGGSGKHHLLLRDAPASKVKPDGPRIRTYSGISRLLPHSYGSS